MTKSNFKKQLSSVFVCLFLLGFIESFFVQSFLGLPAQATPQTNPIIIDDSVLNQNEESFESTPSNIDEDLLNEVIAPAVDEPIDEPLIKKNTDKKQVKSSFKNKIAKLSKKILSIKINFALCITFLQLIILIILIKFIYVLIKDLRALTSTNNLKKEDNSPEELIFGNYKDISEGVNKSFLPSTENSGFKKHSESKAPTNTEILEETAQGDNVYDIESHIFKNPLTQISKEEESLIFEDDDEDSPPIFTPKEFDYENEPNFSNTFETVDSDEDIELYEESDIVNDFTASFSSLKSNNEKKLMQNSKIQSKYNFEPNIGLSLVDFKNKTVLVGYINDKIFVLKKFKTQINSPILASLHDKKSIDCSIYIIQIAYETLLIEVSPDEIKLLNK